MFKYYKFFSKYNIFFDINYILTIFLPIIKRLITLLLKIEFKKIFSSMFLEKNYTLLVMKKEFLYTKLKYSRVPQFDIASGASAALLAGLLGFIVTEKFGFELLDSGDFYTLLMYIGILILILRLLIKSFNDFKSYINLWNILFNIIIYYIILIKITTIFIIFSFMELRMWKNNLSEMHFLK